MRKPIFQPAHLAFQQNFQLFPAIWPGPSPSPAGALPFVLQDATGMIRCVAWGEEHTQIQREAGFHKGEILRVVNGEVKEGRSGALEFHIGYKSRLQLQPDQVDSSFLPALNDEISYTPIGELNIQAPFVNIQGNVDRKYNPKPFTRKDNTQGQRASLKIADSTPDKAIRADTPESVIEFLLPFSATTADISSISEHTLAVFNGTSDAFLYPF